MCLKCDDLREEIADLKAIVSIYELAPSEEWRLPDCPNIRFTPNERYFLRALFDRMPRVISGAALMDSRPFQHSDAYTRSMPSVVVCHINRKLRGTGFRIVNAWGVGYRLTQQLPSQVLARSAAPARAA